METENRLTTLIEFSYIQLSSNGRQVFSLQEGIREYKMELHPDGRGEIYEVSKVRKHEERLEERHLQETQRPNATVLL